MDIKDKTEQTTLGKVIHVAADISCLVFFPFAPFIMAVHKRGSKVRRLGVSSLGLLFWLYTIGSICEAPTETIKPKVESTLPPIEQVQPESESESASESIKKVDPYIISIMVNSNELKPEYPSLTVNNGEYKVQIHNPNNGAVITFLFRENGSGYTSVTLNNEMIKFTNLELGAKVVSINDRVAYSFEDRSGNFGRTSIVIRRDK
ncbi:MAG: hypothetical protein R3321_00365 [Nitrososphaeraceae archaeon]|nr:hypothetical protein [Nitrososphaeraceae archaeon]